MDREIFTISKILYTEPSTYKITDLNGKEVEESYEPELQQTKQDVYKIEKAIRQHGSKYLVKWAGYPGSFESWLYEKRLGKIGIEIYNI